ncbi:hypothetical protein UU5_00600 [Rhodanobacter sp. 115]|nr:hypothetical protein UU5_00600 [Rhodanobacter sp. 115]
MRQVAILAVLHHADRVGALGQLLAFLVQDHRQVRELRHRRAQRVVDVDLAWRVVDVVVAADHLGDAHVDVVHHHGEVVGGPAIGTEDHQVIQLAVGELDATLHLVLEHHRAFLRIAEADHPVRVLTEGFVAVAVIAVVARLLALRHGGLAHRLDLFLGLIGVVRLALGQQLFGHFPVAGQAMGLVHRGLVGIQVQPVHRIQDGLHRFLGGAFAIGILDAQHELATTPPRLQPAIQCGACATDVQETGGAGGETGADGHRDSSKETELNHGF